MELENTVKEVLNSTTVPALVNPNSELLKEIADLKVKLAAALEQGAMDRLKARQMEAVETERDSLKQQLESLTVAQSLPVAMTNNVECVIQYEVKAPDLARWRNAGWCVKHYQFVNNDRDLPTLAVVMERPAAPAPLVEDEFRYSIAPEVDTPRNAESAPVNEPVAPFTVIIEEPEAVPTMTAKPTLMQKLAADKPVFAAISEYGVDAVLDAMDAQVYEKARAAYDAYDIPDTPPTRFESKFLGTGTVTPDNLIIEDIEIIEVLS